MPVINGHKMACDACIRGHRSTKCDHGDSRVLIRVRKPGRPLTACPHLQSQPCDCPKNTKGCGCSSSITVAFPKKQGCGDCKTGPKTIVKTEGTSCGPSLPDLPAATAGTFKVIKKSTPIAAGAPRARPQSYNGSWIESIDMNSCNIIQNGNSATSASTNGLAMNSIAPPQAPAHIAPALPNSHNQQPRPMAMPFYSSITANGQTPRNSISNSTGMPSPSDGEVAGFSLSNGAYMNGGAGYMSNGTFLSNGRAPQPILTSPYSMSSMSTMSTPQYFPSSISGATPATIVRSCCSSKKSVNSSPDDLDMNSMSQVPAQQSFNTPAFSNGNSPIYNTAGMQPAYTYPGNFSPSQPQLPNGQWNQNFGITYSPQQASLQQLQNLQASNGLFQVPDSALDASFEMQCMCGPGCECFGCQMHPQNATTMAFVKQISNQMSHNQSARETPSPITPMQTQDPFFAMQNQPQPQIFQPQLLQKFYNANFEKDPLMTSTTTALNSETPESGNSRTESPQLSVNGSPYDSMGESQQLVLDPEQWNVYNYEFEGGCGGDLEGCQCGEDCACVGCTIHQAEQERRQFEQEPGLGQQSMIGVVKAEDGLDGSNGLNGTLTTEEAEVKKSCCG